MKKSNLIITTIALFSLAACNGQNSNIEDTKVSKKQFIEEAAKLEQHQYMNVHVENVQTTKYTFLGFSEQEEEQYRQDHNYQDLEQTTTQDGEWTGSEWTGVKSVTMTMGGGSFPYIMSLPLNLKDYDFDHVLFNAPDYYINPFSIKWGPSGMIDDTHKETTHRTLVFDEYGYLVSMVVTTDYLYKDRYVKRADLNTVTLSYK